MLVYWLYYIRYLLTEKALNIIPDLTIDFPNYHDRFSRIVHGIGFFIDLPSLSKLFAIFIGYNAVRIALAFYHQRKS